jgi:hypothetical protein
VINLASILVAVNTALPICLFALCSVQGSAQITFTLGDLPTEVGAYSRAYVNTNAVDVSQLLGAKGGPQRWDFSAAQGPNDEIQRMDIVAPGDGGHGADFPDAAYAERTTRESSGIQSWSYYKIGPAQGRVYYGLYNDALTSASPLIVLDAPAVVLPATLVFGQAWRYTLDYQAVVEAFGVPIAVAIHVTFDALVDGYGTMILPILGEVPALRVSEVMSLEYYDETGFPFYSTQGRDYYWLAKGIGQVASITIPPEVSSMANTVLRVFEASVSEPKPVNNLLIYLKGKEIFLSWAREPTASNYRVQFVNHLAPVVTWTPLGGTTNNFLFDPAVATTGERYYRVDWAP